jgi:hypothetical protein
VTEGSFPGVPAGDRSATGIVGRVVDAGGADPTVVEGLDDELLHPASPRTETASRASTANGQVRTRDMDDSFRS